MSETRFVKEILLYLEQRRDLMCWRNNVGGALMGKRWVNFGIKGHADIFGVLKGGQFFSIEAKYGKGRQTPEQIKFEKDIKAIGGIYILAHSIEDIVNDLPDYPHQVRTDFRTC